MVHANFQGDRNSRNTKLLFKSTCRGLSQIGTDFSVTCRLDEVFRGMPESVGFDIEVKMTTPDAEPHTAPQEVERMVTAILAEVREWEAASYRRMVFSSFDPDVAAELRRRQNSVPVSL